MRRDRRKTSVAPPATVALTPRQAAFVREYLLDLNGTQAAIRAGYSARTAPAQACRLLTYPAIRDAIMQGKATLAETAHVTAAQVIAELACSAFSDIGDILDFTGDDTVRLRRPCDIPAPARRAIASVKVTRVVKGREEEAREVEVTEFKLWDKGAALERLGRHLGLFVERHQVTFEQFDRVLELATDLLRKRLPTEQAKEAVVELVRLAKDSYGGTDGQGRAA